MANDHALKITLDPYLLTGQTVAEIEADIALLAGVGPSKVEVVKDGAGRPVVVNLLMEKNQNAIDKINQNNGVANVGSLVPPQLALSELHDTTGLVYTDSVSGAPIGMPSGTKITLTDETTGDILGTATVVNGGASTYVDGAELLLGAKPMILKIEFLATWTRIGERVPIYDGDLVLNWGTSSSLTISTELRTTGPTPELLEVPNLGTIEMYVTTTGKLYKRLASDEDFREIALSTWPGPTPLTLEQAVALGAL